MICVRIIEDLEDEDQLNTLEVQDKNDPETSNDYSLETFILETQKWNNFVPIVVICEVNQSILIKKLCKFIKEKSPFCYTILVNFNEIEKELSKLIYGDFSDFILKIAKLSDFEREIFKLKFEKGAFKILFDGFDQMTCAKCKKDAVEIIKKFIRNSKNQIFVTTQTPSSFYFLSSKAPFYVKLK